jgi:Zn finger protein HypA/HybF involved in hydrogenase expression
MGRRQVTDNKGYAKCVHCSAKRIVDRIEWTRARQPQCYACGGRMEALTTGKSGKVNAEMNEFVFERIAIEKTRRS